MRFTMYALTCFPMFFQVFRSKAYIEWEKQSAILLSAEEEKLSFSEIVHKALPAYAEQTIDALTTMKQAINQVMLSLVRFMR